MKSSFRHRGFLFTLVVGAALVGAGLFFQRRATAPAPGASSRVQVVATIFPLADFAKQVGGDLVGVTTVVPDGVEPHEYEPTPQEIAHLYRADVVFLAGNGIDPWADKLVDDLRAHEVQVVRVREELAAGSSSLSSDAHFWLDPVIAKRALTIMGRAIAEERGSSEELKAQVQSAETRFDELDTLYRKVLAPCKQREFVTTHDAFGSLAERYELTQLSVTGFSPEEDPSAQTLAELSDLVRRKGITTVFTEALVHSKGAETIAAETGAKIAVLHPIEGITADERTAGKGYLELMQENLQQLQEALGCSPS